MASAVIEGKVLRWGNSYGLRLRKADLERAGLKLGQTVTVRLGTEAAKIDLSDLPVFFGGDSDTSERHDEVLGAYRLRDVHGKRWEDPDADR